MIFASSWRRTTLLGGGSRRLAAIEAGRLENGMLLGMGAETALVVTVLAGTFGGAMFRGAKGLEGLALLGGWGERGLNALWGGGG